MSARDRARKRTVAGATWGNAPASKGPDTYYALYSTTSANARMDSAVIRRAIAPDAGTLYAMRTQYTTQGMDAAHDAFVVRFLECEHAPASIPYRAAMQRQSAQRNGLDADGQQTMYTAWLRGDDPIGFTFFARRSA